MQRSVKIAVIEDVSDRLIASIKQVKIPSKAQKRPSKEQKRPSKEQKRPNKSDRLVASIK
jgi:hypothetical protein